MRQVGRTELATPDRLERELGADPDQVFFTLEQLVDRWLVESPEPKRYRTIGLPRAYAAEVVESRADRDPQG